MTVNVNPDVIDPLDIWPPDYTRIYVWRQRALMRFKLDAEYAGVAYQYYKTHPVQFICHWIDTYDPRNALNGKPSSMPFVLFPRQRELVWFLHECLRGEVNGLIEKSRDMGATWVGCAFSVWLWLFWPGASIGWGSRKQELVDRIGDADSIFEKMRMIIRQLPPMFLPHAFNAKEHINFMRIVNPDTGASITGEVGDNIGRGGRKLIYFKDESAHYEHPEMIEAALGDNTRVQIDISSVHGTGNIYYRKRRSGINWIPGRIIKGRTQVFVMDWRAHPEKNADWYQERYEEATRNGLLAQFYQEVDRNYAASIEGIIINPAWVQAAIDAHIKRWNWDLSGTWIAGLDVADDKGGDLNAWAARHGVVLREAEEWGDRDTGLTTQKAAMLAAQHVPMKVMYDAVGIGAGVKAEANRLAREDIMPKGVSFIPWEAGASPMFPDDNLIKGDKNTPLNKDFFYNLKAQGWWTLARRFEKTYKCVREGIEYPVEEMISIDSRLPCLAKLCDELSQPTAGLTAGRLKYLVNKTPDGMPSPNLGDAVMMAYNPVRRTTYDSSLSWVE